MIKSNASENLIQDDFFPNLKSRKFGVDFNGGNVSSDGGVLLLRQVDRKIKLAEKEYEETEARVRKYSG